MDAILFLCLMLMTAPLKISSHGDFRKRLLLHGDQDILSEFHRISTLVDQLVKEKNETDRKLRTLEQNTSTLVNQLMQKDNTTDVKIRNLETSLKQLQTQTGGGRSTYVRWGRPDCPGNGTQLVYTGYIGGSGYADKGGPANLLCLSGEPIWGHYDDRVRAWGRIYGTEYEFVGESSNAASFFGRNLLNNDAPCAVCSTNRPTNIMIPGRNKCTGGWTEEYHGYLVSGHYDHASSSEYMCLDVRPDVVVGGGQDQNGHLLYIVEGRCGSLECPPYVDGRELTCVICSK